MTNSYGAEQINVLKDLEAVRTFAEAGCDRMYLQYLTIDDLDMIELIASEVLPNV